VLHKFGLPVKGQRTHKNKNKKNPRKTFQNKNNNFLRKRNAVNYRGVLGSSFNVKKKYNYE